MEKDISRDIAELPALNKAQLLPIWRKNFDDDPPPKLRKKLMVPILAYRCRRRSSVACHAGRASGCARLPSRSVQRSASQYRAKYSVGHQADPAVGRRGP